MTLPVLTITPGLDGYRLAFSGPDYFEALAEYPTFWLARQAMRDAQLVSAAITETLALAPVDGERVVQYRKAV